jgi:hypothetical protein
MLILRRSNCIATASGIVTVRKRPFSATVESGLIIIIIIIIIKTSRSVVSLCCVIA